MDPKRKILASLFLLLLAFAGSVQASNVFIVGPLENVCQNIECPNTCQSISGNVSTVGGNIDFYITEPSGNIVLYYENVSFANFIVNTPINGTYVINMANRQSTDSVTATLFYGRHFLIVLSAEISMAFSTVATVTTNVPAPFNPWGLLSQIGYLMFVIVIGPLIVSLLRDLIRLGFQKYKDGKSKTPVVLQ
jgi:hypothetical protein